MPPAPRTTKRAPRTSKQLLQGRNALVAAVGVAAVLAAVGLIVASQVGSGGGGKKTAAARVTVAGGGESLALLRGIPQSGNALGKPTAPVTLVEYADLQCPWCARYANDVLPTIVRQYVRPGKVRLEFRGMAFVGADSETALRAVIAAGLQNRMWNVLDLLYRNQGAENSGWVSEDLLRSIGNEVPGLRTGAMLDARDSSPVTNRIEDYASMASAAGINSTPSFEIGKTGTQLQRLQVAALEPSAFRPALDTLLAQ